MRAYFTPLAEADLEEIGDYIALDNPRRAVSFIRKIREHCEKIADRPLGACQGSCRSFYAASADLISDCSAAFTTDSRSGLSVTVVTGVRSRVCCVHRRGLASRALMYNA